MVDFVGRGRDPHLTLQAALETHVGLDPLYHQIFTAI